MESVISVKSLSKSFRAFERREGVLGAMKDLFHREYKELKAVDAISFEVGRGELLGYIGPNGAGKSTSIKMLTGILKPTSGEMNVLGFDPFRDRKRYTANIGVVFGQRTQLWWDIAAQESFRLLASIYNVPQADYERRLAELSEILDLKPLLGTPVRKLSLGQRMRCDMAASLIHNPQILFLDEPTIGLDAVAKDSVRKFLREINKNFGTTIILTTHDLKEIEALCKRILLIDHGKIIYDGSLERIKALPGFHRHVAIDFSGAAPLAELNQHFAGQVEFKAVSERRVSAALDPQRMPVAQLIKTVFEKYEVADMSVGEPELEEVIRKIYTEGMTL